MLRTRLTGQFLRPHPIQLMTLMVAMFAAMPAHAAFHLWSLNEIYTNNSGTLQFIELTDGSGGLGGQNAVGGQSISVSNIPNTITNTFTIPAPVVLPGNTANHFLLFGTAGVQAAGGPAPDFIIPNGFLFSAGGSISFFGQNSGPYAALPTDGTHSRNWSGENAVNSPTNYSGQTGTIVPEPTTLALLACGGLSFWRRRRPA